MRRESIRKRFNSSSTSAFPTLVEFVQNVGRAGRTERREHHAYSVVFLRSDKKVEQAKFKRLGRWRAYGDEHVKLEFLKGNEGCRREIITRYMGGEEIDCMSGEMD